LSTPSPLTHLSSFPTRRSSDLRQFLRSIFAFLPHPYLLRYSLTNHPARMNINIGTRSGSFATRILVLQTQYQLCGMHAKTSVPEDRKSTRLNSSHQIISYAVFC